MGLGGALHYVGSFLLFVALILTVVVDISAPVVESISMFKVKGNNEYRFGAFGYCQVGNGGASRCSDSHIGYNPAEVLSDFEDFSNAREDTTKALTRVFVLHPVGTGITFIAFLLSLVSTSTVLSILATLVTALSFVINAIACIVSWVTFSLIRNEFKNSRSITVKYGPAIYLAAVAAVLCLIATVIMFVTCCAGRRRRSRENRKMMQGY